MAFAFLPDYILGGTKAEEHEFPYQIALVVNDVFKPRVIGGATIIHDYWLLTAAHCIPVLEKYKDDSYGIFATSIKWKNFPEKIEFEKFIAHENYEYDNKNSKKYDIALIRTRNNLLHIKNAKKVLLSSELDFHGNAIAVGYGRTDPYGEPSDKLMKLELLILNEATREIMKLYKNVYDKDSMICAIGENGGSTYCGDSGGPLIQYIGDESVIIGIISFGPEEPGEDYTAVCFTKVSAYKKWILDHINNYVEERSNNSSPSTSSEKSITDEIFLKVGEFSKSLSKRDADKFKDRVVEDVSSIIDIAKQLSDMSTDDKIKKVVEVSASKIAHAATDLVSVIKDKWNF